MAYSTPVSPIKTTENPRKSLEASILSQLNQRSNQRGWQQLFGHFLILAVSGFAWLMPTSPLWIRLPALVLYGFSLASCFAPLHECSHRTAFANNRLNDIVAWWVGVLSFYNSTFYRRFHKWHHRFTQISGLDPELEDLPINTIRDYALTVSGFHWWMGKFNGHFKVAVGNLENCPYIPETARLEVIRSTRLQLMIYGVTGVFAIALGHPFFPALAWLLPLAIGQPILRMILLAEHHGCSQDSNPKTNTRTTLTLFPLRFLLWNLPFHGEHHLYPSIPFHQLPHAHQHLKPLFAHVESGYLKVNRDLIAAIGATR